MIRNSLLRRRSNGGIVIVAGRSKPGETLEQARARYGDLVEGVMYPSTLLLTASK
jgi:hypothetical protein